MQTFNLVRVGPRTCQRGVGDGDDEIGGRTLVEARAAPDFTGRSKHARTCGNDNSPGRTCDRPYVDHGTEGHNSL